MDRAVFIFPKGVFQRNGYLFDVLNLKDILVSSTSETDAILMYRMNNWAIQDFSELIEGLELLICRKENLSTEKIEINSLRRFYC